MKITSYVSVLPEIKIPKKLNTKLQETKIKIVIVVLRLLRVLVSALKTKSPFGQKKLCSIEAKIRNAQIRSVFGKSLNPVKNAFEVSIYDWVLNPGVVGDKKTAAALIIKCYKKSENRLNLRNLGLSSIPPEIGNLVNLTNLDLFDNQLKQLPPEIGNLVNLTNLYLSGNQLKQLPPEIGNLVNLKMFMSRQNFLTELPREIGNLENLEFLYLENNQLKELPPDIGNLRKLEDLQLPNNQLKRLPSEIGNLEKLFLFDLSYNKLKELPVEMGRLHKLRNLYLKGNTLLYQVPLSLGNLPDFTYMSTYETQILDSDRDAIMRSCRRVRRVKSRYDLPVKIQLWVKSSKTSFHLSRINQLNNMQQGNLYEWLVRLERTKDFQKSQRELAKIVCTILQEMLHNEEFKELFFTQIEQNNERCQDRASMALNEIYTSMLMLRNQQNTTLKDQLELLIGCAKTLALRSAVSQVINDHQKEQGYAEEEGVQIYLYCETHLRKTLGLETAIKGMTYKVIGKRDWVDEDELVKTVNKTYLDFLLDIPAFEALLKKQKDYQTLESEGTDTIDDEINDLCMKAPSTMDKLSPEYLEWETEVNVLNKKRQAKMKKIRKKWVKDQLAL